MGCKGVMSETARTPPGSHKVRFPMEGSLFSPAGSPNKALPPQFVSPNEKVVYEVEAGKLQCLLHSVAALAACLLGQDGKTQPGTEALSFPCIPSAFALRRP